ncbi:MAG: NAD(P)/FAD-dependent oxidoreductase [Candidatus Heimdallarchaeota archaeon]
MTQTIRIAGAGISGLSAAISIAQGDNGRHIEVRDKASSYHAKQARGINALRNYQSKTDILEEYRQLGFKFHTGNVFHPIHNQIYFIDTNHYFDVTSDEKPLFYSVARGTEESIDALLVEQAEGHGIDIRWGLTFDGETPEILATGAKYSHCFGYGQHFVDVKETDTIVILQNSKYSPFGYACYLPSAKHEASVILGSFHPSHPSSKDTKQNYHRIITEIPLFSDYLEGASVIHTLSGKGNFGIPSSAIQGKSLLVGERAGFLEAFRGFGIHTALLSGYAAGKALVNGKNYDDQWQLLLNKILHRGLLRRMAENELNIGSEDIMRKLASQLPRKISYDVFRRALREQEKKMLGNLDPHKLALLTQAVEQWNREYW